MSPATGAQRKELPRTIRVLIADDHAGIRKALRQALENHSGLEVCGEAADGSAAIGEARRLNPDVVVLNVSMPVLNGFEAARKIKTTLPDAGIVILSAHADLRFAAASKGTGGGTGSASRKAGEALAKAIDAAVNGTEFVFVE